MCTRPVAVDASRVTTGPGRPRRGLRVWISLLVLGALAVSLRSPGLSAHDAAVLLALPLLCVLDVELGRRAEGGRVSAQRPSKGLSAWPFAAALLLVAKRPRVLYERVGEGGYFSRQARSLKPRSG